MHDIVQGILVLVFFAAVMAISSQVIDLEAWKLGKIWMDNPVAEVILVVGLVCIGLLIAYLVFRRW